MTPFWWACWTAWQTGDEQLQPLPRGELVLVAVLGDRDALDQLHHEVRAGRPAVAPASSTLAMFGWSIRASACRSASNRATTCRVSIPGLITFRATCRRTGSVLLGHEDDAHPALADLLQQLVRADRPCPGASAWRSATGRRPAVAAGPRPVGPGTLPARRGAEQLLDPRRGAPRRRRRPGRGTPPARPGGELGSVARKTALGRGLLGPVMGVTRRFGPSATVRERAAGTPQKWSFFASRAFRRAGRPSCSQARA